MGEIYFFELLSDFVDYQTVETGFVVWIRGDLLDVDDTAVV
jgi:hypothetical protein